VKETNKTTFRSERRCVLGRKKKGDKKIRKNQKKDLSGMVKNLSRENRKHGGDDNVSGIVIG
jgi:hypothetical protein